MSLRTVLARVGRILGRTVMLLLVVGVGLAVGVVWWFRHRPP